MAKMRSIWPCGSVSVGAGPAGRDEQRLRARVVEQAFLRKYAELEIDRPGVVALQALEGREGAEADARIDLDMRADAHGSLQDRLDQGLLGTRIDVVLGEVPLQAGNLGDRLAERALGRAAIENAGLVEMQVAVDEARQDQSPRRRFLPSGAAEIRADRRDDAVDDTDVAGAVPAFGKRRVAQHQIEHGRAPVGPACGASGPRASPSRSARAMPWAEGTGLALPAAGKGGWLHRGQDRPLPQLSSPVPLLRHSERFSGEDIGNSSPSAVG
jgi:hypothetical protein